MEKNSVPFPNIGFDPLKLDGEERIKYNAYEEVLTRLRTACSIQQKEVPDQTALVWRADLAWLLGQFVWREAGHKAAIERERNRTMTPTNKTQKTMKKIWFPLMAICLSGCTASQPDAFSTDPLPETTRRSWSPLTPAGFQPTAKLDVIGQYEPPPTPPAPSRAPTPGGPFAPPVSPPVIIDRGDTGELKGPRLTPLTVAASRNSPLKWYAPPGFVGLVGIYQIAFTTPAATAASLGVGATPLGVIRTINILGTETQTKFASFVPPTLPAGNYRVWVRASNHLGIRSDWSEGLPVTWPLSPATAAGASLPPAPPVNQRAILIP